MFGLTGTVKWVAIAIALSAVAGATTYTVKSVKNAYNTAIEQAEDRGKAEIKAEQDELLKDREIVLQAAMREQREELEAQVRAERAKVTDLRRMLLIEHDLDRLLQEKPGLILPRVNKGTEEIFKELEELTQ